MPPINYIYVQCGYGLFGVGETAQEAIEDACNWLAPPDSHPTANYTPSEARELLQPLRILGEMRLLRIGDDKFDDYLEADHAGSYAKINGRWFADR